MELLAGAGDLVLPPNCCFVGMMLVVAGILAAVTLFAWMIERIGRRKQDRP